MMGRMKVMTMNVNGVRSAVRKGLWDFVAEHDVDVVCLQEVRAHDDDLPATPDAYRCVWLAGERRGYSGVGVMTRLEPGPCRTGLGVRAYDSEGRVLRMDLGDLTLLNVYVPSGTTGEPRQSFKMRFLKRFKGYVKALLAEGRELVVAGDINIAHRPIDLKNWRSNQRTSGFLPAERAFLDGFLQLGLHDTVREIIGPETPLYSWWSSRSGARERDVGWRLDYQFTTPAVHRRARSVVVPREPLLSDHAPVIVEYAA